ncbi:MAG: hypothetical protein IKJ37_02605 [Kiritimatiellae bacterium]|nr:hypothetical protein [Kiritimatiellia bacterium]
MTRYNLTKMAAAFLVGSAVCADAYGIKTNYVDCSLNDYSNSDGTSWEKAFKTIQEGVDAADTGDVVLVAPGYYDEGGATIGESDQYLTNRVCITKRITLRSRDGRATRDSTFIVGRHASNPDDPGGLGMGLDAVRCIRVDFKDATHGTVIEGFTIMNGATRYNGNNQAICSSGGGIHFGKRTTSEANASYLVDCVVSNCAATRGAGMYFGNAVRCRFTGNAATHSGSAVRASNLYWCIVDANYGAAQAYLDGANVVNTTFANSNFRAIRGNNVGSEARVYNSVLLSYNHDSASSYTSFANCVLPSGCDFRAQNTQGESAIENCRMVDMSSHQFVSTATGDFRPLSGGDLPEAADVRHLELIPEKYRYTDFNGNDAPKTGAMTVGAIVTPVTVNGGVILFDCSYRHKDNPGIVVGGYIHYTGNLYAYTVDDSCPVSYAVDCVMPTDPEKSATRSFYAFCASITNVVQGGSLSTTYYPPMRNSNRSYMLAPPVGFKVKIVPYIAERTIWADPNVDSDSEMDGTEGKPYNTLQGAVDAAFHLVSIGDGNRYFVIKAKPGSYDKGGVMCGGVSNRVAITNNAARIRIYAVNGPDETFIAGAEDPASEHGYKFGPEAMRCVASSTGVASINGFTLTGGRVALNNGSEERGAECLYGGGVYSTNPGFMVEDCVFTNCVASRGGVMYGGVMRRCRIVDCVATWNGALRGKLHASACVFENTKNSHIVGQDEKTYNCTFVGSAVNCAKLTGGGASSAGAAGVYNSVVYGFNVLEKADDYIFAGVYYDKVNGVSESAAAIEGLRKSDIYLADENAGDYRLCSVSSVKDMGDASGLDADFWRYGSAVDIEGNPYNFRADGTVEVGAYAKSVPSVMLTASVPEGVAAVSVSPAGENVLTEGEAVVFTANDAATRNFQGFYLNGELVSTQSTYAYAYDIRNNGQRFELEARYVPYWYVDPSKSDSNSGRSWADAKKSLAEVMKLALSGDTVYAEAGTYEIGDMIQHENGFRGNPLLRARVVLTNGVSLVSRRGPEKTFIVGESDANAADYFGCGPDALRCVYMYPDTRLEGFTLTGGRTYGDADLQDDNNRGAGVHGWYLASSIVKDCVISNCVAGRGAGSTHVTAVNCRYLYNRGYNNCAAAQHCFHHNCFFDFNVSGTGETGSYVVGYWRGMRNCTFGAHNFLNRYENVIGPSSDNNVQHPQVYNTLVLNGRVYQGSGSAFAGVFTNCAFTVAAFEAWPTNCLYDESTIFADPSELQADENGVPIVGKNVAIDAGDIRYVDPLYSNTDLAGNPRAMNGSRMDIGCYEADWKGRYAADLGARLSVSKASPAVYETDSRTVALVDNTEVTLDFRNASARTARQSVAFKVIGEGVLTLIVDGETHTFTDSGAVQMFVSNTKEALRKFEFSFAGTGRAELINCTNGIGMSFVIR